MKRARHSAWQVYRVILGVAFQAARGRTTTLLLCAVIVGTAGAFGGLVTKFVVDALAEGDAPRAMAAGIGYLVLTGGAVLVEDLATVVLQSDLGERISQEMEQRLMTISGGAAGLEHLERPEFADKVRMVSDRSFLPYFALTNLNGLAGIVFGLTTATVLLGSIHPALGLVSLAAAPGAVLSYRAFRGHFARYDQTAPDQRLTSHYLELATQPESAKEIRMFGLGPTLLARHKTVADRYLSTLTRDQFARTRIGLASGAIFGVAMAGGMGFVGALALNGRATLGDVALAVQVIRMALGQLQGGSRSAAWLAELSFVGERYLWLLDYQPAVIGPGPDDAKPAPAVIRKGITFESVDFTYPGTEKPVLSDVSLFLPAGATIAVVGENGAGKSSLVKLLCRFYDPTAGRILIDGVDLRDLDLDGWRAATGIAFQDFVRFQLIARETVGVGDLGGDDTRVAESVQVAGAGPVVDRLPDGLDTQLGRTFLGGTDLSEGEWQRLALARGLMRPAPALVMLDEPTAALDARAEHEVFARFADMARPDDAPRPITLLVSHRFSTVRMADLIIVVEGGRVTEVGSHSELLAADGRYAELFTLQASRYQPTPLT